MERGKLVRSQPLLLDTPLSAHLTFERSHSLLLPTIGRGWASSSKGVNWLEAPRGSWELLGPWVRLGRLVILGIAPPQTLSWQDTPAYKSRCQPLSPDKGGAKISAEKWGMYVMSVCTCTQRVHSFPAGPEIHIGSVLGFLY